jgi:hypothetical protein
MSIEAYLSLSGGDIYTIDIESGQTRFIGNTGIDMNDLAFAPNGVLYGISNQAIWQINPTTAQITLVEAAPLGSDSIAFDSNGTGYIAQ